MTITFKNISEGVYNASISDIEEIYNRSGFYLRFIFTVNDSKFIEHNFSATLKVSGSKQSGFYRWITNLLGYETDMINTDDLIGNECLISIVKTDDNCFSVHSISPLH